MLQAGKTLPHGTRSDLGGHLLVRGRVELEPGARVLGGQCTKERRDRELPLPVDPRVDDALLVDLDLEPRAAAGHEVRDEDLLVRILRLHQIGAGGADELRDDHALGAVDDERAGVRHHGEIPHEHGLLADLARLRVHEADGHRERHLVRQVLLTALLDRDRRRAELVIGKLDCERAGVVLDRRDIVDRLAKPFLHEPVEGSSLDVDEVGKVEDVLQTGKTLPRGARGDLGGHVGLTSSRQAGNSSTEREQQKSGATRKGSRSTGSLARVTRRGAAVGRKHSDSTGISPDRARGVLAGTSLDARAVP